MNPQKIIEYSNRDWMKGISLQDTYPIAGIFKSNTTNFNPFETMGYLQPALAPVQMDATHLVVVPNSIVSNSDNTRAFVCTLGPKSVAGTKNLSIINPADQTVLNYSLTGDGGLPMYGLGFYKGRLLFAAGANIYSVLTDGTTENLLLAVSFDYTTKIPVFHLAPNGYVYFTGVGTGSAPYIGRIDTVTGAGTNTASAFALLPYTAPVDITNDGRYVIIVSDGNPSKVSNLNAVCSIHYWNMDAVNADYVTLIPDAYLIASRFVDGRLLVFGSSGIWQCGYASNPRLIVPLTATQLPKNPYNVWVQGNILYWNNQATNPQMYAYGATVGSPILFSPFSIANSASLPVVGIGSGNYSYATIADAKMYVYNSGTTRTNLTAEMVPAPLSNPWRFLYAKVVLKSKLSSGQQIAISIHDSEGNLILNTTTKSFASNGAKKTFKIELDGTQTVTEFEDIQVSINPQGGAVVQRVTIYGVPIDDNSQLL
jgi:hypothetical protein